MSPSNCVKSSAKRALLPSGVWSWEDYEKLRQFDGVATRFFLCHQSLVAETDMNRARSLLDAAEAGTFRLSEDADSTSRDDGAVPPEDSKA